MKEIGKFAALSQDDQIKALTGVAFDAANQFGIRVSELRNISHSFNSTFQLIDDNAHHVTPKQAIILSTENGVHCKLTPL